MVEISMSGSGEGPGWETGPGYSTGALDSALATALILSFSRQAGEGTWEPFNLLSET
jgi:hypothetical protein